MGQDFTILQGASLEQPFYWYSGAPVTALISAITLTCPPVFTSAAHNLPVAETPVELLTIRGPAALNTEEGDSVYALRLSSTTFSVASLNASGLSAYLGGGYLRFTPPKNLTGYTARMQVRRTVSSEDTLLNLTSAAGELVLGGTEGSVVVTLTPAVTAALEFTTAVYDLELIDGAGVVTRLAQGCVTLDKEVTR